MVNNAFNVCAASIGHGKFKTLLLPVYITSCASVNDVEAMCAVIDKLTSRFNNVIIAGDFNFPSMRWHNTHTASDSPDERILWRLVSEHNFSQIITHPTRGTAILDLVCLSELLNSSDVELLPPIAGSDHNAQLWQVHLSFKRQANFRRHINTDALNSFLNSVD